MSNNRNLSQLRALRFVAACFLFLNLGLCCSLNEEGKVLLKLKQRITSDPFGALSNWIDDEASVDPCNWFGVECSDRRVVVVLNLIDLCLGGTLAPELVNLIHIKSIILRNNSFSGTIPEEIVDLKELEILDLGYNNFSGHLLANFGSDTSLAILLLDNNELLVGFSPEINELKMLSECQVDENQLTNAAELPVCSERSITWHVHQNKGTRRSLLENRQLYSHHHGHNDDEHGYEYNRNPTATAPVKPPVPKPAPPSQNGFGAPSKSPSSKKTRVPILALIIGGGAVFLLISSIGLYLCKTNKVANVRPPWATGISGQLQKAFVTGFRSPPVFE